MKNTKSKYQYGWHKPEAAAFKTPKGLNREVVEAISGYKQEPEWMREFRLGALLTFEQKMVPTWGADLSKINFDDLYYYINPADKKFRSWDEVPKDIKDTYEKIGIPQAERQFLAGVGAQYDSEMVYHNLKSRWEKQGVIFLGTDDGLAKHPDIFRQYFGTVVPPADNKFAALNSAVWSGGSFVYVPAGVQVTIPLQAYFRINAANMGQFERTLIVAEEGSSVHYVEGCFIAGARVVTPEGEKAIEDMRTGDLVLTHMGRFRRVKKTMKRKYAGKIYKIRIYGDSKAELKVTGEHPLLISKRIKKEYRNSVFEKNWSEAKNVTKDDYLLYPVQSVIPKEVTDQVVLDTEIPIRKGSSIIKQKLNINLDPDFFRLVGYFLAEGHVDKEHYLTFSYNNKEKELILDTDKLLKKYFGKKPLRNKIRNNGLTMVLCSTLAARFFAHEFGSTNRNKHIAQWMFKAGDKHLTELIRGMWLGDGSYDKKINLFRYSSVTKGLINNFRDLLLRLGIIGSINSQRRKLPKQTMHNVVISRLYNKRFGEIVGKDAPNGRKEGSPFYLDGEYLYLPIKSISVEENKTEVFNLSVEEDESYVAEGVVSHNCTAPIYSTDSLHAAVVEIIVKKGARVRYTTIQNWSTNVYNLVTKRMLISEEGVGEWIDGNIGSRVTMKYPSVILNGKGAKGDILSLAFAGAGQHLDAGGKAMHLAPDTTSTITSKSVSTHGGRSSYRGMVKIINGAKGAKSFVRCDALILDKLSRSDTYPVNIINEQDVTLGHEASVSKVGEQQLFYLRSRGLSEVQATALVVNGFIEPIVKELPLEYAVELNRLINLSMEGSVG